MINFLTTIPDCDSHNPALLDLLLSSGASIWSTMAFSPLGNSDHVVVSVSIYFPLKLDPLFHCIAYDYSHVDWDGLSDNWRDFLWEDIFKSSASATASEFCEWVQDGIDAYIPHLIVIIRSRLIHLHGFQLLVLLSKFIEITLHQQNISCESKVKFRQASNCCKGFMKQPKLQWLHHFPETWLLGLLANYW